MNYNILNTVNQEFINNNLDSDIAKLLFQKSSFEKVDIKDIIEQIEAKKKCEAKLPSWFQTSNIYYPNKLNIEQTSSEIAAHYKSTIVSGDSLIDITGGFGVDAYYFSNNIKLVTHCEINKELSEVVKHNYKQLNKTITCIAENGIDYLKTKEATYDWIYVDPSRRHDLKGKVFFLKDCEPNLPEHLDALFKYSDHILVKTSPLLDISIGLEELKFVKEIHIVAINNDVKELLWVLHKDLKNTNPFIKTVNIKNEDAASFNFNLEDEMGAQSTYSNPKKYLYQPNASILKSGAFKLLSEKLSISKLHPNTHLYTSDLLIDFPGRSFKIESVLPYHKKTIKKLFKNKKANIATKNFPESVKQLRERLTIHDGGEVYLFFTTKKDHQKVVLLCYKV